MDANREAVIVLDGADGYFDQHTGKAAISDNPISKLPPISRQEYNAFLTKAENFRQLERNTLLSLHRSLFPQWAFELSQGFNILLYGVGSKRDLVLDYAQQYLDSVPVLVVNGYNPLIDVKEILSHVVGFLLDEPETKIPKNIPDLQSLILSSSASTTDATFPFDYYQPKVVVIIHNIDGYALRNERTQSILSSLASHSDVSMIATVDHINAPALWDTNKLAAFNFVWHDATTLTPYTVETSFADPLALVSGAGRSLISDHEGGTSHSGIIYVLESLTSNARGLYRVLISNQLQAMEDEAEISAQKLADDPMLELPGQARYGLEFKTLYQRCSEEFIVTNELNYRTMLTEFYEHEMLMSTRDVLGTEIIYAPFDKQILEKLLEDDILTS
ncbi:origin recognition complex, subunit 2 [Dipodascopsis uninucleata]